MVARYSSPANYVCALSMENSDNVLSSVGLGLRVLRFSPTIKTFSSVFCSCCLRSQLGQQVKCVYGKK